MTDIAARLAEILPAAALRDPAPAYLEEPRGRWQGQAAAIVAPGSVAEVAAVLRLCNDLGAPVIPMAGALALSAANWPGRARRQ